MLVSTAHIKLGLTWQCGSVSLDNVVFLIRLKRIENKLPCIYHILFLIICILSFTCIVKYQFTPKKENTISNYFWNGLLKRLYFDWGCLIHKWFGYLDCHTFQLVVLNKRLKHYFVTSLISFVLHIQGIITKQVKQKETKSP